MKTQARKRSASIVPKTPGPRNSPSAPLSQAQIGRRLTKVFARFKGQRTELIPLLQATQNELGYLPLDALCRISHFTGVPESTVYGVVTFYSQFYLVPQGRYKVKVCQGTACHVRASRAILDAVNRRLGITSGQTTEDMKFSLERVACFGSCALAPVMVVNDKVYGRMTPDRALKTLEALK